MKAKILDRQNIIFDHTTWNEDRTKYGMASDFDAEYLEYVSGDMPSDNVKSGYYQPYYEESEGKIYQKWEFLAYPIEQIKQRKIAEIAAYDKSSAVDEFLINGVGMWLDRDTRASLFASITAEEAIGRETTVLWTQTEPPFPIELPIIPFRGLLKQLEVYAKDCFNTTAKHIAAVFALTSIEDVNDYDFTTGYPEKLSIGL